MLTITIPETKYFDERTDEFKTFEARTVTLEHSLVSVSKWESKWKLPFLNEDKAKPKTQEMMLDYIRCMSLDKNYKTEWGYFIPASLFQSIQDYIDDPMTATTVRDRRKTPSRKIITSEVIYCWMIQLGIPSEYEKWHLNRLLTLIKVCSIEGTSGEKMSKQETLAMYKSLNASRRARSGSRG